MCRTLWTPCISCIRLSPSLAKKVRILHKAGYNNKFININAVMKIFFIVHFRFQLWFNSFRIYKRRQTLTLPALAPWPPRCGTNFDKIGQIGLKSALVEKRLQPSSWPANSVYLLAMPTRGVTRGTSYSWPRMKIRTLTFSVIKPKILM